MFLLTLVSALLAAAMSDSIPIGTGTWVSIGPLVATDGGTGYVENTSGRVTAIAPDPSDPSTVYIGTGGGGVWKTSDAGQSWTPLSDSEASLFIGAVAVAPSNTQVIYVGTGEANNGPSKSVRERRFNIYSGRGVLKSTDGGSSWTLLGKDPFVRRTISKIVISPSDENVVYAAVGPKASDGVDGNTGVWKSKDGGVTWNNSTAKISTKAAVTDLLIDPGNPDALIAAFGDSSGDAANGLYRSTNGGDTWTAVSFGPRGTALGKIALAMPDSNPQIVFASVANPGPSSSLAGVYKSVNGGISWKKLALSTAAKDRFCPEFGNNNSVLAISGDYHNAIAVDPNNTSKVYIGGLCVIASTDGGDSWNGIAAGNMDGPHHDHHALVFDANGLLWNGNDGGVWRLDDPDSNSWTNLNAGLQTIQIIGLALHPTDPNAAVAGTQDNGILIFNDSQSWQRTQRGDGGTVFYDPTRPARVFSVLEESPDLFARSQNGGATFTFKSKVAPDPAQESRLWYFPMAVDPNNGHILIGTTRLWLSTDAGTNWKTITSVNQSGWQTSEPITAIMHAPSRSQVVYAAAGGHIFMTNDMNASTPVWTMQDFKDSASSISAISVHPKDSNWVCAARETYAAGRVLCSLDGAKTWRDATGDLPEVPVLSLAVDFVTSPPSLFVGTLTGVYASMDGGYSWQTMGRGLPNTAIPALSLRGNLLGAGTHGRGVWEVQLDR